MISNCFNLDLVNLSDYLSLVSFAENNRFERFQNRAFYYKNDNKIFIMKYKNDRKSIFFLIVQFWRKFTCALDK